MVSEILYKKALIKKYLDKKLHNNDKHIVDIIIQYLECEFCPNIADQCPDHYCQRCKCAIYECDCVICKRCNKYNMVYDQCRLCMKEICINCTKTCPNGCGTVMCWRCQDTVCDTCDEYINHLTF